MFDTSHLHPMMVHFPIALAMVGLLFELYRIFIAKSEAKSICGECILYLATLSAIAASLTGELFTGVFSGQSLEVKELHETLAVLSTIALVITSGIYLYRRFKIKDSKYTLLGLGFYLISAALIGATGFFGGNLVYTYMIGL